MYIGSIKYIIWLCSFWKSEYKYKVCINNRYLKYLKYIAYVKKTLNTSY